MSYRVLLCDDEPHILRAAEFKFRRAGYEVDCAFNGEEGWTAIQQRTPDLVITDCQMPVLNGIGLAERIHSDPATKNLPVIMLTAKGFELPIDELKQKYGILMVIGKPFSPRDLLDRAEKLLADSRSEEPAASIAP